MSRRNEKNLSMEDRILWSKVARTAIPLPGKVVEDETEKDESFAALLEEKPKPRKVASEPPARPHNPASQPPNPHRLDRTTHRKLAKGKLRIDGKVDLHGLTQAEAHSLLLSFLHQAYAAGRRHVLIVTGKGSSLGSDGVLRRAVPAWFATPPFRALVGAHEDAERRHGGSGAIYVRLRRREDRGA
ncbi:Smr/MutS family protein [Aquamicrobium sp. LC103]|uniref:Smr/MutS family protein n=1 Tax=Aquamicrobium sp. LC103 TaxID=1120658 RepID=UPI00063E828D|nr:Smr/MutS family protein [Aquamicrobium sp. LC103]TKT82797.1 DNA mismatch repair protein MutS [Aquamicrobium sp. LC103]